jgi:imidazolonepropionase-like amidohydrolase
MSAPAPGDGPSAGTGLAFLHVTVIDGTGAPEKPDMTVVVTGGQISDIGEDQTVPVPRSVQMIDGSGKFLIPGLIDMHVHTSWDSYFVRLMLLANGITSTREMFAKDPEEIRRRREELDRGDRLGPRILAAGPIIDGVGGPWPGSIIVSNAAEARKAVDATKLAGFDFVKIYSALNREEYYAIAEEAKKAGISFAGHVPRSVSVEEASDAGQKSLEHLYGVLLSCSSQESEIQSHTYSPYSEETAEVRTFSEEKAQSLYETLRKNGTWQTPTLVVLRNAALHDDAAVSQSFFEPTRLQYVPYSLRFMWALGLKLTPRMSAEQLEINREYFQLESQVVGEMQRAHVGILAGTDTPNPYVYPGFSLHDELGLLVSAGLTPMEAIESATRNPAIYLGMSDSLGTIEKGKAADLVLLDADPLINIQNTQKIHAVVLAGRLFSRPALDDILAEVKRNRWKMNPAALILIQLVGRMLRKVLYAAFVLMLGLLMGMFWFRQRKRRRLTLRTPSPT